MLNVMSSKLMYFRHTLDFAALIHTFPFIVYNIRWGQMEARYAASPEYWTGIACLVPMVSAIMDVGIRTWADDASIAMIDFPHIHVDRSDQTMALRAL